MKLVFVLMLFLLHFGGICQNIDSLEALLKSHTAKDTARVRILSELAFDLRGDDIVRGAILAQEALVLSRQGQCRL
jgi:hypothetical protein